MSGAARRRLVVPLVGIGLSLLVTAPAGAVIGGEAARTGTVTAATQVITSQRLCSGVLVAPRIVLLALHCRAGHGSRVRVGNPDRGGAVQFRRGLLAAPAPQLQPPPGVIGDTDVEALVLDRPVAPSPVAIAPAADAPGLVAQGSTLLVAGFGEQSPKRPLDPRRTTLKEASIIVASCIGLVAGADGSPFAGCARPAPSAAAYAPPGNPCAGDSGAPVLGFSESVNKIVLAAVLSGGVGAECAWSTPSIFTPAAPLLQWIASLQRAPLAAPARPPSYCRRDRARLARARRHTATARQLRRTVYEHC